MKSRPVRWHCFLPCAIFLNTLSIGRGQASASFTPGTLSSQSHSTYETCSLHAALGYEQILQSLIALFPSTRSASMIAAGHITDKHPLAEFRSENLILSEMQSLDIKVSAFASPREASKISCASF